MHPYAAAIKVFVAHWPPGGRVGQIHQEAPCKK
jgi:hypothetical protein